jgi:cytochrome c peroxidase
MTPNGKEIPHERRCSTCHRPPLYSVRLSFDVDTGGMFDTPHLLGVAASAPYLHDGRAQSLEELWTTYNTNDLHGVSSYMNKIQLNDLIEFLKTI